MPPGLIVANAFPATLDIRMEFYNATIDLVQRHHVSYQDAIFGVRQMVRESHERQTRTGNLCQHRTDGGVAGSGAPRRGAHDHPGSGQPGEPAVLQLCFGALLLLFTASCVLVVRFINDPARLGTLFTITGVSIVGLVAQMVSLWKQKVTADIVALLAHNLQPGDTRAVIEVLFAKL